MCGCVRLGGAGREGEEVPALLVVVRPHIHGQRSMVRRTCVGEGRDSGGVDWVEGNKVCCGVWLAGHTSPSVADMLGKTSCRDYCT